VLFVFPVLAAVTLTDFSVAPGEQEIFVYWETASETGNLGFYVWRSQDADTGYEKLPLDPPAEQFIPSEDQGVGALYEYMDTEVTPGVVYYYKVQDVPDDGSPGEYSEVRSASIAGDPTTETPTDTPVPTSTLTPTPQPGDEPGGEPQILFWASETTLDAGDCTTLQWQTENVASVYLDGDGVPGQGGRTFCPCEDETHILLVYLRGGGTEERTITLDTVGTCSGTDSPIVTPTPTPGVTPTVAPQETEAPLGTTPTPSPEALPSVLVPTVTTTPTPTPVIGDRETSQPLATSTETASSDTTSSEGIRSSTPTPVATRAVVEGGASRAEDPFNRALVLGVGSLFGLVLIGGGIFLWKRWR
jgi:hypothetical protein